MYEFLRNQLNYEAHKIILYGQSIGSGPSTFLASNINYPVGGLILHSGIASGLRVILPNMKSHKFDFFPNIDLVQYINCPIFVIHGTDDQEVNVANAQKILQKAKRKNTYSWFVEKAGHNNIENDKKFRYEYFKKLKEFLSVIYQQSQDGAQLRSAIKADEWSKNFDHIYTKYKILP